MRSRSAAFLARSEQYRESERRNSPHLFLWNTCSIYMVTILGVACVEHGPLASSAISILLQLPRHCGGSARKTSWLDGLRRKARGLASRVRRLRRHARPKPPDIFGAFFRFAERVAVVSRWPPLRALSGRVCACALNGSRRFVLVRFVCVVNVAEYGETRTLFSRRVVK